MKVLISIPCESYADDKNSMALNSEQNINICPSKQQPSLVTCGYCVQWSAADLAQHWTTGALAFCLLCPWVKSAGVPLKLVLDES